IAYGIAREVVEHDVPAVRFSTDPDLSEADRFPGREGREQPHHMGCIRSDHPDLTAIEGYHSRLSIMITSIRTAAPFCTSAHRRAGRILPSNLPYAGSRAWANSWPRHHVRTDEDPDSAHRERSRCTDTRREHSRA